MNKQGTAWSDATVERCVKIYCFLEALSQVHPLPDALPASPDRQTECAQFLDTVAPWIHDDAYWNTILHARVTLSGECLTECERRCRKTFEKDPALQESALAKLHQNGERTGTVRLILLDLLDESKKSSLRHA